VKKLKFQSFNHHRCGARCVVPSEIREQNRKRLLAHWGNMGMAARLLWSQWLYFSYGDLSHGHPRSFDMMSFNIPFPSSPTDLPTGKRFPNQTSPQHSTTRLSSPLSFSSLF
jgi:hypothetical protein